MVQREIEEGLGRRVHTPNTCNTGFEKKVTRLLGAELVENKSNNLLDAGWPHFEDKAP